MFGYAAPLIEETPPTAAPVLNLKIDEVVYFRVEVFLSNPLELA